VRLLLIFAAALLIALVTLGVLGYELLGHVRRLLRTVTAVNQDLRPQVDRLRPPPSNGRHRAGVPRP
jgi:hypothetical protein